uniref:Uncharacterized protein n=1 Tax=Arundo donax TaxID=35708 RepID=A0A0A9E4X9_ARUDO
MTLFLFMGGKFLLVDGFRGMRDAEYLIAYTIFNHTLLFGF